MSFSEPLKTKAKRKNEKRRKTQHGAFVHAHVYKDIQWNAAQGEVLSCRPDRDNLHDLRLWAFIYAHGSRRKFNVGLWQSEG